MESVIYNISDISYRQQGLLSIKVENYTKLLCIITNKLIKISLRARF